MEKNEISHANRYLLNLLSARRLNSWCEEKNLPYSTIYNLTMQITPPTYSLICKLLPYIEPAKWFYPENVEIPYTTRLLPEWNPDEVPYFVRKHRYDYKELIGKYGMSENSGLYLFVNHRAKPSIALIAKACADGVNPEEFFTSGDESDDGKFYPDRGNIVSISGKNVLVLSKEVINRKNKCFVGVDFKDGRADLSTLRSVTYIRRNPELIGNADDKALKDILSLVRALLK